MNSKVSIVIPVYNGANYLREAIDSALAQTYENVEVIVINDGSDDNGKTERIALSYGNRIRYFVKLNGGVASALNFGIRQMTGDFFSWLSHDDLYLSDKIKNQMTAVAKQADQKTVVFCDYYCIDSAGVVVKEARVSKKAAAAIRCFLATDTKTGIHGCSFLIPKYIFAQLGYFDESRKTSQDYDMWFRIAEAGLSFVHVEEMLVVSRQHPEQDSRNKLGICLAEADALHSRVIASLTEDEVKSFSGDSLQYFIDAYQVYRNAGYYKTADSLLRIVCKYATLSNELEIAAEIIRNEILQSGEHAEILALLVDKIKPLLYGQKSRPRVVLYNNVWRRGGVERVLVEVTAYLQEKHSVVLITADAEENAGFALNSDLLHINIHPGNDYVDRIVRLNVLLEADLFIGNSNLISSFIDIYPKLQPTGIKTIAYNHGNFFLPFCYPWLNQVFIDREKIFLHANVVTWLTNFGTHVYMLSHDNGVYMPNPPRDIAPAPISAPDGQSEKIILCVGRLYDSIKRVDRALTVFQKVLEVHPDAKLHLVGGYDLNMHIPEEAPESIADILNRLGLSSSQVVFWGEQEHVEHFYEKASLFILTSDSEGFGVVLTEAGAFGLPSVIFNIPGLEDIISDGVNGFVVEQDNIEGMAEKILLLFDNDLLRQEMGCNARKLAERFSRKNIFERWGSLVHDVLCSESQEALNEVLKKKYVEPVQDKEAFLRRVVIEYEQSIRKLISTSAEKPALAATILSAETVLRYCKMHPVIWCWKVINSVGENGWKITCEKIVKKLKSKGFNK